MSDPNTTDGLPAGAEDKPQIQPYEYTRAPSCYNCGNNCNCKLGHLGDLGICLLYTDGGYEE